MEVKGEITTRLTFGFRCHPNYGNDLRHQYNIILADLNDSTLMTSLSTQVAQRTMNARKVGNIPRNKIIDSNYSLS